MTRPVADPIKHFWSFVDRSGGPDSCWEWIGGRTKKGYGSFGFRGKTFSAHRISYEISNNISIPADMCICHHCDNPPCVNPKHLFLGTKSDNSLDMYKKGRRVFVGLKGQDHPRSKLTDEDIRIIRSSYRPNEVSYYDLAKQFHVSPATIFYVVKRETWTHI